MLFEKKVKKSIPFPVAPKRIKFLINLTRDVTNLYTIKYKTLLKVIKKN